ncbi:unnamed protein product [Urochloa humidicola]
MPPTTPTSFETVSASCADMRAEAEPHGEEQPPSPHGLFVQFLIIDSTTTEACSIKCLNASALQNCIAYAKQ